MLPKAICDTVSIMLMNGTFEVARPQMFTPDASNVLAHLNDTRPVIQTMSTTDKLRKCYKPQLMLKNGFYNRNKNTMLFVTFSAPKLLYGDNLHEVTDSDFETIVSILLQKLKQMGVETTEEFIRAALVCRIHYCKNIVLAKGLFCDFILKDIEKADISRVFDSGHTDYRNDGHCMRIHTKRFEFAIYDKIQDLKQQLKSPTRSIEDRSHCGYSGIDIEQLGEKQVLRIETRLNSRKIIRRYAERVGIFIENCTFEVMFNSLYAQIINNYNWQKVISALKPLWCLQDDVLTVFNKMQTKYKPAKALQFIGMRALLQDTSPRHIRKIFERNTTALKLLNEVKEYDPNSHYKEDIFNSITQMIKQHTVIDLSELSSESFSFDLSEAKEAQDLYSDLEDDSANDNISQSLDSWVALTKCK